MSNCFFYLLSPTSADLDELAVDSLQCSFILQRRSVLQRLLSHLLLPFQLLLDHPEAAPGPALLPAVRHHPHVGAAASVRSGSYFADI